LELEVVVCDLVYLEERDGVEERDKVEERDGVEEKIE
jgi:hypothetical protein